MRLFRVFLYSILFLMYLSSWVNAENLELDMAASPDVKISKNNIFQLFCPSEYIAIEGLDLSLAYKDPFRDEKDFTGEVEILDVIGQFACGSSLQEKPKRSRPSYTFYLSRLVKYKTIGKYSHIKEGDYIVLLQLDTAQIKHLVGEEKKKGTKAYVAGKINYITIPYYFFEDQVWDRMKSAQKAELEPRKLFLLTLFNYRDLSDF